MPGDLSRKRFGLVAYPAVVARAFLARALAELGVFDEGRDHGQEAIRLAEALDHPFSLIWASLNLGRLEGLRGEYIRAIMSLERAVTLSQEWDIAYLTPIVLAALGHVYARSGRVEEGVSWLQKALAGYTSAGIGYLHSMSTVQLGEAHLEGRGGLRDDGVAPGAQFPHSSGYPMSQRLKSGLSWPRFSVCAQDKLTCRPRRALIGVFSSVLAPSL